MTDDPLAEQPEERLVRLPAAWEVLVQLVGTFGLAVFLVLYYVLVMQPREQRRYDELRQSVDSVVGLVRDGRTLLSRDQADRLRELFISSAAPEMARQIERTLPGGPTPLPVAANEAARVRTRLSRSLEEIAIARSRLLRGLSREDGVELDQALRSGIRESRVAEEVAARAVTEWPYRDRAELEAMCGESLRGSLRLLDPLR